MSSEPPKDDGPRPSVRRSRRLLNSVAGVVASRFESRFNDAGGYWALGPLLAALQPNLDYEIDLAAGTSVPELSDPDLSPLPEVMAGYFGFAMARHRLAPDLVRSARLLLSYDFDLSRHGHPAPVIAVAERLKRDQRRYLAQEWERPDVWVPPKVDQDGYHPDPVARLAPGEHVFAVLVDIEDDHDRRHQGLAVGYCRPGAQGVRSDRLEENEFHSNFRSVSHTAESP